MDGDIFAENIVVTDHHLAGRLPLEGKILRITANDRPVPDHVARPHSDMSSDHGTRLDPAPLTDHRTRLDDDTRPHLHA